VRRRIATVSIVGRPNVGKSTLFNRLIGRKKAIVLGTPGVTRDRNYEVARLGDSEVMLVDTGGFLSDSQDTIVEGVRRQIEFAVDESEAVILVVDGRAGVLPQDEQIAAFLRPIAENVVVAVNKIDEDRLKPLAAEFFSLGLGDVFPISAEHKLGLEPLIHALTGIITSSQKKTVPLQDATHCAIVGRPNVGKSSIVNALLGQERVLVHEDPGTTRDAIDSLLRFRNRHYVLIDTAGIRRRSRISHVLERQSVIIAERSIRRADVVLLIIDAKEPATAQDAKIASIVLEQGRGLILVCNKWDLIDKDDKTINRFKEAISDKMGFVGFAPLLFVSAKTRQRLIKLFDIIDAVNAECARRIGTGVLNRFLQEEVFARHRAAKGKRAVKFYFATQASVRPPTFVLFTNRPGEVDDGYLRFVEGCLRDRFGFEGAPIRLVLRKHH